MTKRVALLLWFMLAGCAWLNLEVLMADIKFKALRVMNDGEVVLVGDDGKNAHGETVYCLEKHDHSKACAQVLLDAKIMMVSSEFEDNGTTIPAVYETPRERIVKWFKSVVPAPQHVEMPKRIEKVKEGKKTVDREVNDHDLV